MITDAHYRIPRIPTRNRGPKTEATKDTHVTTFGNLDNSHEDIMQTTQRTKKRHPKDETNQDLETIHGRKHKQLRGQPVKFSDVKVSFLLC